MAINSIPSSSLRFPFKKGLDSVLERNYTVEQTLTSSIKCFLLTEKGSRLGNGIGCTLPSLLQEVISENQLEQYEDQISNEIELQFPEINLIEFSLIREKETLLVRLKYYTPLTDITSFELQINSL